MIKYNCEDEYWKEIVANCDCNYENKTVQYFHCSNCGEDF
jgi:hypothetical protein